MADHPNTDLEYFQYQNLIHIILYVNILAGSDKEHVPVLGVLDDDQGVAGDGNEGLQLGVGAAILHHNCP